MDIEMKIVETGSGKYRAILIKAPWLFAEADTAADAKELLNEKLSKLSVPAERFKKFNIVPWYIIGQAAQAERDYILTGEYQHLVKFEALTALARQLHPWEG